MKNARFGMAAALLGLACAAGAAVDHVSVDVTEPRAFGYSLGDVVSRRVLLTLPPGLALDAASLPAAGQRGKALELRRADWQRVAQPGGQRYELTLDYQVFLSPREVRTLEMPPVKLRFEGGPRPEEVRIDAWPLTVAPLAPAEPSPRTGLGELRPDWPAPLIDAQGPRQRLALAAALVALLLAYLGIVYLGLPWWSQRHRPFTQAWRALRPLSARSPAQQRQAAYRALHQALNRTAGEVLFETGIERFVAAHPRFAPLRDEIAGFFARSRAEFFTGGGDGPQDAPWLRDFARRCRDAERGSA